MPRIEIKKREYKLKDLKAWIKTQMYLNNKTQKEVGEALGLSQSAISQMLKISDKKSKNGSGIKEDPFSYGQVLTLCEFFRVDEKEKQRLLTM